MIHVVTLNYLRPVEDINQHLDAHKEWLIDNVRQGKVILAGPMEGRTGGLLLASCSDREELDAMMAQDPFIESGVASYEVYACVPALASLQLPPHWAPLAKFV